METPAAAAWSLRRVHAPDAALVEALAAVLIDCVEGGAFVTDGDAARMYARHGWIRVGDVPNFARCPDGRPCSTTYFYRQLE